MGLRIGVPDTTMEEARPWYPTGKWSLIKEGERVWVPEMLHVV